MGERVYTIPKVNVIAWLKFARAYFEATIHHSCDNTTGSPPRYWKLRSTLAKQQNSAKTILRVLGIRHFFSCDNATGSPPRYWKLRSTLAKQQNSAKTILRVLGIRHFFSCDNATGSPPRYWKLRSTLAKQQNSAKTILRVLGIRHFSPAIMPRGLLQDTENWDPH